GVARLPPREEVAARAGDPRRRVDVRGGRRARPGHLHPAGPDPDPGGLDARRHPPPPARPLLVPSEWQRTLVVSRLAACPNVGVLGAALAQHRAIPVVAVMLSVWCFIAVAIATWTSLVIYRLRRRAQEALQLGQYTLETKIGEGGMGVV